jgi:hypothetical protein
MPTIPMLTGTTITVRGVTAEVRVDGAEKGIERGSGPWRRVVYQCDYSQSDEFCDGLVGSTTNAGGPGGVLTFPGPHQTPMYRGRSGRGGTGTARPTRQADYL